MDNKNVDISIIVPVYNTEKYLEQCLESLVKQTHRNIEIIIVNDGSTDNSQDIICRYLEKYPNIVRAFEKENEGLGYARNFGIEKACGKYLLFVDSDDYVDETMCEKMVVSATEKEADICICNINRRTVLKNGEIKLKERKLKLELEKGDNIFVNPYILRYCTSFACNKLIKKSLFEDNGIIFPQQWFEDSATIYNLVSAAKRISFVEEPLYFYRIGRDGAITSTLDKRVFDIFKSCNSIIDYYKSHGIFEQFYAELEGLCIMHIQTRFELLECCTDAELVNGFIDECFDYLNKEFPGWRDNQYYQRSIRKRIIKNTYVKKYYSRNNREELKAYFEEERAKLKAKDEAKPKAKVKTKRSIASSIKRRIRKWLKKSNNVDSKKSEREKSFVDTNVVLPLIHETEMRILNTIDKFCKENNITYFLTEGTLLGAVRHGGIIPWDDDVDIAMKREDYDKFRRLWDKQIIDNCALVCSTTFENFHLSISKIILLEDVGIYGPDVVLPQEYRGLYVDIFPIDECIDNTTDEFIQHCAEIRRVRDLLLVKARMMGNKRKTRELQEEADQKTYKELHQHLDMLLTKYNGSNSPHLANFCSSYFIDNEYFNRELFDAVKYVNFENAVLPIPIGAEAILTKIYGNYMLLPPKENRVNRHKIEVDLEQLKKNGFID